MDNSIGPDGKPRILYLLKLANAALVRVAERDAAFHSRVTGAQLGALFVLTSRGPMLMKDLADQLDINNSAMTGLVSRMEEAGLARREADDKDGRAVKVVATDKGAKAAEAALPAVRELNGLALEGLTKSEIAVVTRFLNAVVTRFSARARKLETELKRRKK